MTPKRQVIAYNYPGWHRSQWKDLDEWSLLDERRPLFEGQQPLRSPARGRYDDCDRDVLRAQIQEALAAGIDGFTYFLYFGADGFVLDEPTRNALDAARNTAFEIGVTWCLRQPYRNFPVPLPGGCAGSEKPDEEKPRARTPLFEFVPRAMLDTPLTALLAVFCPAIKPSSVQGKRMSHRYAGITLSQVLDMLTKVREIRACGSALELSMDILEGALSTTGLVHLPLSTVSVLLRELDTADPAKPVDLPVEVVVDAFGQDEAAVTPPDIRYLAALGGGLVSELDVFKAVRLDELITNLTPQGLDALSCRDVRAVLEGIAVDRAAAGRR